MSATITTTGTTISGSGTATFTSLASGTYTVTEGTNNDFAPSGSTSCTAFVGVGQVNTGCTFSNGARGQIVVTKQVEGGTGSFTFSLTGNGGTSGSTVLVGGNGPGTTVTLTGSFTGLAPGATFTVSESVPS